MAIPEKAKNIGTQRSPLCTVKRAKNDWQENTKKTCWILHIFA